MNRILVAAVIWLGLALNALAQAPPPVPALPDSARLTSYSISTSTCACSVGFQIYGSGTDVDEWIQVYVNGVAYLSTDPVFGWSLSSVSPGGLTGPRPITNAILTFNAAQTGTILIVGAERPRRLSQFSENRGVTARDLNQAITDQVAVSREMWDKLNRAIVGQPGEVLAALPSAAARANLILGFGNTGQPVAAAISNTLTTNGLNIWTGLQTFAGGTTTPLTDGQVMLGTSNTLKTALQIYCPFSVNGCNATTGGTEYDVVRGVLDLENSTGTVSQANAIAGYAFCNFNAAGASYPGKGNCAAISGFSVAAKGGALAWGAAFDCQDNLVAATYSAGAGGSRACQNEVDIGIWDTTGTSTGNGWLADLQGAGTTAGTLVAFNMTNHATGGLKWSFGLNCSNQAVLLACVNVGVQSTGANSGSQQVAWEYVKSSSQFAMEVAAAATGGLVFTTTDTSITNAMDWSSVTVNTCILNIASRCSVSGTGAGNFAGMTVTGSFTATGLVTNADLVNAATTVNGVVCTLGSTCTVSAAASLVVASTTITGSCTSGFNLFNNAGVLGCQANTGGGGITVGTTTVSSGTTQQILYDNAGVAGEITKGNNCVYGTGGTGIPSCLATIPAAVQGNITTVGTIGTGVWGGSPIDISRGGTSAALTASAGGIVYSGASALAILSGTVTAGQCLLSGSSAAPTWGSCSGASGITVGTTTVTSGVTQQLLYDNAGVVGEVTKANNSILGSNGTGVPSWVTTLPFVVSLATGGTNNNLTAVSGGVVWSDASKLNISAALAANCAVYGGGAGVAPATSTSTCVQISSAGAVTVQNATNALSQVTGALIVSGGIGVASDVWALNLIATQFQKVLSNTQFAGMGIIQQSTSNQVALLQCVGAGCDNGAIILSSGGGAPKVEIIAGGLSYFNTGNNLCVGAVTCSQLFSVAGLSSATTHVSTGSVPTGNTGTCSTAVTVTGGASVGNWTSTSACNIAGTIILSGMPSAPTGYNCDATDITTAAVVLQQTASSVTSVTFTVRATNASANDNIRFKCLAY